MSGCSISLFSRSHLGIHSRGWHTINHNCAERTDQGLNFPGHKSRIWTAPVMASRICCYQYWYPEVTMKIIKTILSESLEFALKSNLLEVTDPYNVKPLSMTDPHTTIWPIRTTVVTNIAGFLWILWNDYTPDCINEHVSFEKTYK